MKKIIGLILVIAIGFSIFFFQQNDGGEVDYNKVVMYRLKDIFGFEFKAKSVELNELNELVISQLDVYGKSSTLIPMLSIQEIRGNYDTEKLKLENEIDIKNAKIRGISIPTLEMVNAEKRKTLLISKLNNNFRKVFEEWDNKDEIQKVLDEITGFYEKSKLSNLKQASRAFNRAKTLENVVKATNIEKKPGKKADLKEYLEELNKGVDNYNIGISESIDYDPNIFLKKRFSSLVKKYFVEIEMIEFLFDKKVELLGSNIISNLRELYKAQFYSPEAQENFPELSFDKIEILEKLEPDSQNVMVGFLSNVSSKSSDNTKTDKIKILIQGDFEKYGIKGIDARIGIYKDNNKIITYNIMIKEVPISNYSIYEDDERALMIEKAVGFIALKGIVHKAEVRGDLTYQMSDLQFYRNPTIDNVVSYIFDVFEAKKEKRLVVIMDDKPGKQSFIEVEYGNEYLDKQSYSTELATAYYEDVMDAYFRDITIESEEILEKKQELAADYQKTLAVIELIKNKLKVPATFNEQ